MILDGILVSYIYVLPKIAELVREPKQFEGRTIQLTGKCVKVNAAIMNRNWIHLKDGSQTDLDLIITSNI
jgi:hypothetical protein